MGCANADALDRAVENIMSDFRMFSIEILDTHTSSVDELRKPISQRKEAVALTLEGSGLCIPQKQCQLRDRRSSSQHSWTQRYVENCEVGPSLQQVNVSCTG